MTGIRASATRFENWQRGQLGPLFVEADLERKHAKMERNVFSFLRATYWRWAEGVLDVLAHQREAADILAIGDTHLENFGTWRDAEGRLIWGANDFDDACVMPWPLDLVRLAASAILAAGDDADSAAICAAIWGGYRDGLSAPGAIVLERHHTELRTQLLLGEDERKAFWEAFDKPGAAIPAQYRAVLTASLPAAVPGEERIPVCFPRRAGTGSLGKPRFVARLDDWRGGPVVREAKAMLPSAWALFHPGADTSAGLADVVQGRYRAPDPSLRVDAGILVRRLSPNSRKIEADERHGLLLKPEMLRLMGREIANCHAGDRERAGAVRAEVARRQENWLERDARAMAQAVARDQKAFAG